MNELIVFNPVTEVKISSGAVEVKQLSFIHALTFIAKIGAVAGKLFDGNGQFKLAKRNGNEVALDLSALEKIIQESGDLSIFLVKHSTKKDDKWVDDLSATEGLILLRAAIELNLSEDVLKLGKEVAGSVKAALMNPAHSQKQ